MAIQDVRQGAASIVFLVAYTLLTALTLFGLIARRPLRRFLGPFIFSFIRIGANIASLGWSISLYDNFDWLIASLILGAEGERVADLGPARGRISPVPNYPCRHKATSSSFSPSFLR